MSDLISKSALIKMLSRNSIVEKTYIGDMSVLDIVKAQPTIEAVLVVEAEWIKEEGAFFPRYKCSVCRAKHGAIWFKYCPSCGAKMEGGAE